MSLLKRPGTPVIATKPECGRGWRLVKRIAALMRDRQRVLHLFAGKVDRDSPLLLEFADMKSLLDFITKCNCESQGRSRNESSIKCSRARALDFLSVVLDPLGPRELAGMQLVVVEGVHGMLR
jgi:hypothetical protein